MQTNIFESILIVFFCAVFMLFSVRKNFLLVLVAIEMFPFALNLFFVISTYFLEDLNGSFSSLILIVSAAAESAIGLALVFTFHRIQNEISPSRFSLLKG
jgi:NADH-quinone oxidoreductase subunit K